MTNGAFDLVIIGAGSAGLVAADFAGRLGIKVAIVERDRIGGDCTWTGCIPSKALLKAAKVAHAIRTAGHYGISTSPPKTDMSAVRGFVRSAVETVYRSEATERLSVRGVEIISGAPRFLNRQTIVLGDRTIRSKRFLIATGANPHVPPIPGLTDVPFVTYRDIFENDQLPPRMIVVGGGPVGVELAQAYQRLGSRVTIVAPRLLPQEGEDARRVLHRALEREGVRLLQGRASSAGRDGNEIVIRTSDADTRGDMLLIATGRRGTVDGLGLEKAGVHCNEQGISVDRQLRTSAKNIFAAGDVIGGSQYTHLAAWQAFKAARNALFPGASDGFTDLVPRVTFTDPEIAHVGPTTEELRSRFGDQVEEQTLDAHRLDRAICENDRDAFIKVVTRRGVIVAATVVGDRAGETLTELIVAMDRRLKPSDIANSLHPYPTYSTGIQQLAADLAIGKALSGFAGRLARGLSRAGLRAFS